MKKQPTTVKILDPKKQKKLRQIKAKTGVPIERTVDELLEIGLREKKFNPVIAKRN